MLKWSVSSMDDGGGRKVNDQQTKTDEDNSGETDDAVTDLPQFRPRNYLVSG